MTPPKDDNDLAQAGEHLDPMEGLEAVLPTTLRAGKPQSAQEELEELAPPRTRLYDLASLAQDRDRELLSLADLPLGYGLGELFNGLLGGGLAPGDLVACGASSAGAGKTAFLMQLADGLALRCAQLAASPQESAPLTPVLILSELSPPALTRRSLAWLTQERASTFRAGKTAERYKGFQWVQDTYERAKKLLAPPEGILHQIQGWQRQVQVGALLSRLRQEGDSSGTTVIQRVRSLTQAWVEKLKQEYPDRDIWPILLIDPIQRWQDHERGEVDALNELAEALDIAADEEGWVVLVTSDTNKQSARGDSLGDATEIGASLFRGSYKLLHCADVAFYLDKTEGDPKDPLKYISVKLFKNRYGPSFGEIYFAWDTPTGRFRPLSGEEQERYEAEKQSAQEAERLESLEERERQRQEVREIIAKVRAEYTDLEEINSIAGDKYS